MFLPLLLRDLSSDYNVKGINNHTVTRVAAMPFPVVTQIHSTCHTVVINAL